jgi:protein-disulfide isomerase
LHINNKTWTNIKLHFGGLVINMNKQLLFDNQKHMFNKAHSQIAVFALVLSLVALGMSGYSLSKVGEGKLDDKTFGEKVEKGINDYIDKQRAAQAGQPAAPTEPVDVKVGNAPVKGDKKAPVTIIEYSDFECPFCGRFHQSTLPQIITDYVDKGKVLFAYKHFPLSFHKNSKNASMASECAKEQGGDKVFFKYHDILYVNQTTQTVENLKKWAADMGLDTAKFNSCLDTQKYAKEVDADFAEGQSIGVSGTPAFFINGRMLSGAQPFSAFQTIIDEELAK